MLTSDIAHVASNGVRQRANHVQAENWAAAQYESASCCVKVAESV
jgi:hypothetical protein